MRKKYEAPLLVCDEIAPDTMIASWGAKNGNPGNNQNCWGYDQVLGQYNQDGDNCIGPIG